MADRVFASALMLLVLAYTYIAFTQIEAPFQYDPLGPESWPQILGLVTLPCLIYILLRPDVQSLGVLKESWGRLVILLALLIAYAWAFQPFGFIFATFLFCTGMSLMLGAKVLPALIFGSVTSIVGYFLCTGVLELNLPAGPLRNYI